MRFFISIFFIFILQICLAQQQNIELNNQFTRWIDAATNNTEIHSAFKPLLQSEVKYDSLKNGRYTLCQEKLRDNIGTKGVSELGFLHHLKEGIICKNLVSVNTDDFSFSIDPLFYMEVGQENDTSNLYKNTRGLMVSADIGEKVSFSTAFYESQAYFPSYVENYTSSLGEKTYPGSGIVPGQGRAKPFKQGGFDYGMASAYVNYVPNRYLNIRTGHGKHFIGEGYRSLLLSDNAFNYPYLRISSKIGKKKNFEYTNLYASLFENQRVPITNMPEAPFIKKGLSVHYLNYVPSKWLQVGLFESTIWDTWDDVNMKSYSFNSQIYNPIIGINYLTKNSIHKSTIGTNLKLSPTKHLSIYNQLSFAQGKHLAYQTGVKTFDLFGIVPNLFIQGEYNQRGVDGNIEYTQYGQSIEHHAIENYSEFIGILNYQYKRIFIHVKAIHLNKKQEYNVSNLNAELGYLINPTYNLNLYLGINNRSYKPQNEIASSEKSNYIYFGLRTSLRNLYYDF
jgi:hypothetical protein